jgi:alpha-amylase/alpha-mannosidase (GH57 family)
MGRQCGNHAPQGIMPAKTVHVAIVWHMHQPVYKDARTGVYQLPWVRLHASKDYLDMVEVLREFPDVRATFNFVPCLTEQLEEYAEGTAKDVFLDLSRKAPEELSEEEKFFLLRNFFTAHPRNAIGKYPIYNRLYRKTLSIQEELSRGKGIDKFSSQDFLNLQTLFNLVWIDPSYLADPDLRAIAKKTKAFGIAERDTVLDKQLALLRRVIPECREALSRGQIEISASAYFHPILPLLCDMAVATQAMPDVKLPRSETKWSEDALAQLETAVGSHERVFGKAPAGLWPPEGGVSEEALRLARQAGFVWAATDEDILARALRMKRGRKREVQLALYSPYAFDTPSGPLSLVFRDKVLSDLIGFTYMNWEAETAVQDFILRLRTIAKETEEPDPLVTVVLDGENCWEFYENDGRDFLRLLYGRLSQEAGIQTTTVSGYLERFPAQKKLSVVPAGSWIDSNFRIWVGHPEDNAAWDLVADARKALREYVQRHPESSEGETVRAAWRQIYMAQGSDWYWWFGDIHTSMFDFVFDSLFRNHLAKVYELLAMEVPPRLYTTVLGADGTKPNLNAAPPTGYISPEIDGNITHYYEWEPSGHFDLSRGGSSMQQALSVVKALYYGFDAKTLYVRIDTVEKPRSQEFSDITLFFEIASPTRIRLRIGLGPEPQDVAVERRDNSEWKTVASSVRAAMDDIIELGVSFQDLGLAPSSNVEAILLVVREGMVMESWPAQEKLSFEVPSDEFESSVWTV